MIFSTNKNGISLLEVVIAMGVMGLVSIGMVNQFDAQRKMVTTIEAGFDTSDALAQLRTVLSDSESCRKTFENVAVVSGGVTITDIKRAYKDPAGVWQYTTAFSTSVPFNPNIKFNSFFLKGATPIDGLVNLSLEIERLKPGVMGGAKVNKNIQLFVATDAANKIIRCHGSMGAEDLADLCNSIEGATWDATRRKCNIGGSTEAIESSQYSIASYTSPAPGKIHTDAATPWTMTRRLVVTNPRKTKRAYLVIAQTTIGSDGGPDWVNLMLKWDSGNKLNPFYNHDNVVAFDQKVADYNYDPTNATTAKERPSLLQIVSIEVLDPEEVRTYSGWIRNSAGGDAYQWGSKLSAVPID